MTEMIVAALILRRPRKLPSRIWREPKYRPQSSEDTRKRILITLAIGRASQSVRVASGVGCLARSQAIPLNMTPTIPASPPAIPS